MELNQQKIINEKGNVTGFLIPKNNYKKLREYIEDLEDSLELTEAIKNSNGFRLWDNFVKEYKLQNK